MKKAGIIALGSGVLAAGIGVSVILFVPKEKIVLSIDDNKITWIDRSNVSLIGSKYHIYNDEFLVNKVTDQSYFLTKEKLIDEAGPEKVKKVNINYTDKSVYFTWDDANDLGTDNNIWVSLYNEKDRQVSYSNVVKMNFASGVYKYVVELKGVEYEVWDNSFSIDMSQLKDGITVAKLYAIDNRGNSGEIASIPLYNYKVILSKENENLRFHIDDRTQKYTFKAFVNGKDKGFVESEYELNELLKDDLAPDTVDKVDFSFADKMANISWVEVEDKGQKFTVRIDAYGMSYYNSSSSDDMEVEKKDGIKGYYYSINKNSKYDVTDKDNFTTVCDVDYTGNYGSYYFHIASVDNSGNISKTKTFKFEIKDPNAKEEENEINKPEPPIKPPISSEDDSNNNNDNIGDKEEDESIESLIKKVGNISKANYDKAVNIINKIPQKILSSIKSENIKIYLTSGEAEDIYVSLTGTSTDSITGAFVWGGAKTAVICETAYLDSTLLHELGHATDYILGNKKFISNEDDFISIYEEEKNLLFENNEYIRNSSYEYFAEAFAMYFNQNHILRTSAPKTYEYIKSILK